MKQNKWILILLSGIFLLCMGCGGKGVVNQQAQEQKTSTYIDCVGREVELPDKMNRIAAIDAFSGELMVMIGAGEQMVACPQGVKSDLLLQEIYPELEQTAVVQSGGAINAEALLELDPDVVLLKYGLYISDGEVEKLEKLGIPYLVIGYTTMEEQIDAIRLIGQLNGGDALAKADKICDYYEHIIELVSEKKKQLDPDEQISVYHSINQVFRTDGKNSLGADWISAVGCIDCSVGETLKAERDGYFANQEQLFVWDPDAIICNDKMAADFFKTDEGWSGLRAVREGAVYQIPVGATRWGQAGSVETFFGMLWLGTTVYPELYQDVDLEMEVRKFYQDVLGISVDKSMYEKIISGEGLRMRSLNAG